jgi:hypothetical protein
MSYFTGYRQRLQLNHQNLVELALQLTQEGLRVQYYFPSGRTLLSSLRVVDGEEYKYRVSEEGLDYCYIFVNAVRIQFNEVPFRWTFEYDTIPDYQHGSSMTGREFIVNPLCGGRPGYADWNRLPFSVQDVKDNLRPFYLRNIRDRQPGILEYVDFVPQMPVNFNEIKGSYDV